MRMISRGTACLVVVAAVGACAAVDVVTSEEAAFTEAVKSTGQFCQKGTDGHDPVDGYPGFSCDLQDGQFFRALIAKDAAEAQSVNDSLTTAFPTMTHNVFTYKDVVVVVGYGHGDPPQ